MTQHEIEQAVADARRAFLLVNPVGYLRKVRLGRAEYAEVQRIPRDASSGILLGPLKGVPLELVDADSHVEVIYERF